MHAYTRPSPLQAKALSHHPPPLLRQRQMSCTGKLAHSHQANGGKTFRSQISGILFA